MSRLASFEPCGIPVSLEALQMQLQVLYYVVMDEQQCALMEMFCFWVTRMVQ